MATFFSEQDPAPSFTARPQDVALEQRISKLAEFACKNGPPFVNMIREKQAGNPEYSFLSAGPGADYFTWKLYCNLYNLEADQPLHLQSGQGAPHQSADIQHGSAATIFAAGRERDDHWQALQGMADNLPPDLSTEFSSVLANLTGSRQSIKDGKDWFTNHLDHAPGLAARMALHQSHLPNYDQQIHIIYLANDVLLKSLPRSDAQGMSQTSEAVLAFRPALPLMLNSAFRAGNGVPEVHQRLITILDHWGSRGVYSEQDISQLKRSTVEGMQGHASGTQPDGGASYPSQPAAAPWNEPPDASMQQQAQQYAQAPLPMPLPVPVHPPQHRRQWDQGPVGPPFPPQPSPFPLPTASYLPPPAAGPGFPEQPAFAPTQPPFAGHPPEYRPPLHPGALPMPDWQSVPSQPGFDGSLLMPPDMAQPQPGPPMQAAADPMSFPPGLLPALVKEHLRTEENYEPLSRKDVERAGIPPVKPADSYLLARLDKFYAELQDYRPGTSRADLQDAQKRQKSRVSLGGRDLQEQQPTREAQSDGSYRGEQRDGGPAGLGFGESYVIMPDDPFSQYRKKRSGFYHESIARSSTVPSGPQAAH